MSKSVILVKPQMGENIGAVARSMANFGLTDLRIVSPRDGWPNEKAEAVSAGGLDIIKKATIFKDLQEAINDLEYIYATTSSKRYMNKEYISSKNLAEDFPSGLKVGFLFGRESSGLSNGELVPADKIVTVETGEEFSSLNLAHAATIIFYELFFTEGLGKRNIQNPATKGELDYFLNFLTAELGRKGFFKVGEKREIMERNIANIFTRIENLSKSEVQTLTGMVRNLSEK